MATKLRNTQVSPASGQVASVVAGGGISVNSSDPANPVVSLTGGSPFPAQGVGYGGESITSIVFSGLSILANDILVAAFNISMFSDNTRDITDLQSFTALDSNANSNVRMRTLWKKATGSEGASITFPISGSATQHSGALIVVRGSVAGTIAAHNLASGSATSLADSGNGDLPLGFGTQNDGTTDGNNLQGFSSGGWVPLVSVQPTFHASVAGYGPKTSANYPGAIATVQWGGTVSSDQIAIVIVSA